MASSSLLTGLENKVVLITGGSSGIGRYSAVEFAKNGCKVVILGRNQSGLAETTKLVRESASSAQVEELVADLESPDECRRVVAETVSKFGQLDVLVNSAGILQRGSIETLTLEEFDKQMNINVRSVFVITQAAVPHLKATKGSIVNISSVTGHRAAPGVLSYNVSKAALDHFTRSVALELAPAGVRVNAVNPGVVVTNCHRNAGLSEEDYAKFLEHSKTTHALGRVATAEEVAKAIVFLSSNELAGFMTGVTLPIDGGRGITCPR
jgi:NAD(P)-dependent dehydrogenase (short-subunit alcohol dehydrogenase family)